MRADMTQLRVAFLNFFFVKPSEIGVGTHTKIYGLNLILVHPIVILRETETELPAFLKEQSVIVIIHVYAWRLSNETPEKINCLNVSPLT
jgi:hypothetical protein